MVEGMQPPQLGHGPPTPQLKQRQAPKPVRRGRTVPWHYQREAASALVTGLPGVVAAICGSSVELTGTVSSVAQSQRASRAAWAIPGVVRVRNGIRVVH
jgi:hypothetical protein